MEAPAERPAFSRLPSLPSWLLAQTALHAGRLVADGFAAEGARGYHYRLLATLAEAGPSSQAELGRRSGIHLSDVVAALNELSADGYVQRTPDPSDKRRNVVVLTDAGRARLEVLEARVTAVQEDILAPLDAAERGQLVALLTRLLGHHAG
ncbi:MarR family winged helix-turn-helix transcriptional regulator [Cryptosporangium aurantiacum]|uniref:DNA-binding transcriptional regulator, MarR family n=1 Tax=Cryptosporangium aurantiacum TaxID=134849 RepID=A0A1M7K8B5_9ACTN|nr:MarR family transcriptional regulator [Cryptosporangium aurantiacum]SHM61478.1 DNA-binding transcriptional regulator, MarR family [Cryptosporangium aurantiacum]